MAEDGDEGRIRTSDTTLLRLLYRGGLHRALVLRPPLSYLHHRPRIAAETGGVKRVRTADLFHAMESLSQLSYNPVIVNALEGREAIPRPGAVICRLSPAPYGETAPVHWRSGRPSGPSCPRGGSLSHRRPAKSETVWIMIVWNMVPGNDVCL